jgi:hypothetical protein
MPLIESASTISRRPGVPACEPVPQRSAEIAPLTSSTTYGLETAVTLAYVVMLAWWSC